MRTSQTNRSSPTTRTSAPADATEAHARVNSQEAELWKDAYFPPPPSLELQDKSFPQAIRSSYRLFPPTRWLSPASPLHSSPLAALSPEAHVNFIATLEALESRLPFVRAVRIVASRLFYRVDPLVHSFISQGSLTLVRAWHRLRHNSLYNEPQQPHRSNAPQITVVAHAHDVTGYRNSMKEVMFRLSSAPSQQKIGFLFELEGMDVKERREVSRILSEKLQRPTTDGTDILASNDSAEDALLKRIPFSIEAALQEIQTRAHDFRVEVRTTGLSSPVSLQALRSNHSPEPFPVETLKTLVTRFDDPCSVRYQNLFRKVVAGYYLRSQQSSYMLHGPRDNKFALDAERFAEELGPNSQLFVFVGASHFQMHGILSRRGYTSAELITSEVFPPGRFSEFNVVGLDQSNAESWAAQVQGKASVSERELIDTCLGSSLTSYLQRLFEASDEKERFAPYTPKQLGDMAAMLVFKRLNEEERERVFTHAAIDVYYTLRNTLSPHAEFYLRDALDHWWELSLRQKVEGYLDESGQRDLLSLFMRNDYP